MLTASLRPCEDAAITIQHAIDASSLRDFAAKVIPRVFLYDRFKTALAEYRAIQANGGWASVPSGPTLRPGMTDERVPELAARLRASEQRFRAMVESVPSAILLVDEEGTMKLANAQAETMFGYTRADLVGQPVLLVARRRGVGDVVRDNAQSKLRGRQPGRGGVDTSDHRLI